MAVKIRETWPTVDALRDDPSFFDELYAFALNCPLHNMHVERLLALVQAACGPNLPVDLERMCANGYLAQWLQEHTKAGGCDPRAATEEDLLRQGVPLARQIDAKAMLLTLSLHPFRRFDLDLHPFR